MANIVLTARDEKFIASMKASAGAVGQFAAKINVNLKGAFKAGDFAAREFGRGIGKVGDKLKSVGTSLSTNLSIPLALASGAILKTFSDIEKLKIGLNQYGVSLSEVKQLAKTPGLGISEAAGALQKLAGAKYDIDLSKRAIVEFGNALHSIGGGKEDLLGVFTAFSQIKGKGKVQAEEINQIAERLPIVRSLMTEIFGTADTEKLQKIGITADEFLFKLTERLSELPRVSGGFSNSIGNIGDSLKIFTFKIGETADRLFNFESITNKISAAIEGVQAWFDNLSPTIQKAAFVITGLAIAIGPIVAIFGGLVAVIPAVVAGFSLMAPLIAPIIAIGAGIAAVAMLIKSNWATISPFFSDMANSLSIIFTELKKVIVTVWTTIKEHMTSTTGSLFKTVVEVFSNALGMIAQGVRAFGAIFSGDWETVADAVKNIFKRLWNGVLAITQAAISALAGAFSTLFEWLGFDGASSGIQKAADDISGFMDKIKFKIDTGTAAATKFKEAFSGFELGGLPSGGSDSTSASLGIPIAKKLKFDFEHIELIDPIKISERLNNALDAVRVDFDLADKFRNSYQGLEMFLEDMSYMITESFKNIGGDFISNAFEGLFSGQGLKGAFKNLLSSLGSMLQDVGKQFLLANKVIAKMKATLASAGGVGAAIGAIALGGVIKGIASNIQIPALANGGLAYAPTLAMVGDNRGAGIDPEVIAPLSKLRGIMADSGGFGGGGQLMTRVSGNDLLIWLDRAQRNR